LFTVDVDNPNAVPTPGLWYAEKDYATAVTYSLEVLSDTKDPETAVNARYLLAHSLFQAGVSSHSRALFLPLKFVSRLLQ
jgi:hypothetical protein